MVALSKVDSPYFKNNPISEDRIPGIASKFIPTMSEEAAGKAVVKVVRSKAKIAVGPFMMKVFAWLNTFFPSTFRWMTRMTGYKEPN